MRNISGSVLKVGIVLALLAGFGYLYGLFAGNLVSTIGSGDTWPFVVLAVPILLPIFEFMFSRDKPRYLDLIQQMVLSFVLAVVVVVVFSNYPFGGDYKNYAMSLVGLVCVLGLSRGVDYLVVKYILKR